MSLMKYATRILCSFVTILALGAMAAADPAPRATQRAAPNGNPKPPATATPKQRSGPFHGKLKSVNLASRSFVMGQRTFHVNEKTRMVKGGKPATLRDAVVGENVSGAFRTADDGKLVCVTLRFGPKVEGDTERRSQGGREPGRPPAADKE